MWILVLVVVSMVLVPHSFVNAKSSKDKKARDAIVKAIGKAVEGKYSTIDMVNISKKNDNSTITVYNKTVSVTPPPPPPPTCMTGWHYDTTAKECVQDITPPPPPPPTGNISKVCLVGDLKGSTVPNLMKNCNIKVGLGDLGYGSDLSYFKGLKFDKCVVGNHDSTEDGSSSIYKEALAYCGDHWSLKIGNSTMVIGLNTNGDVTSQVQAAQKIISQSSGIKTIILISHKGGHVPPNSHHPAEAATLYKQLEALIPTNVKLIEVFGHNHVSSSAPSQNWYQAGAGGKSFYSCGTDAIWTFCDNSKVGYLELTVSNKDGTTAAKFVN